MNEKKTAADHLDDSRGGKKGRGGGGGGEGEIFRKTVRPSL